MKDPILDSYLNVFDELVEINLRRPVEEFINEIELIVNNEKPQVYNQFHNTMEYVNQKLQENINSEIVKYYFDKQDELVLKLNEYETRKAPLIIDSNKLELFQIRALKTINNYLIDPNNKSPENVNLSELKDKYQKYSYVGDIRNAEKIKIEIDYFEHLWQKYIPRDYLKGFVLSDMENKAKIINAYNALLKQYYISSDATITQFSKLFTGGIIDSKINWLKDARVLYVFWDILFEKQILIRPKNILKIIKAAFNYSDIDFKPGGRESLDTIRKSKSQWYIEINSIAELF